MGRYVKRWSPAGRLLVIAGIDQQPVLALLRTEATARILAGVNHGFAV